MSYSSAVYTVRRENAKCPPVIAYRLSPAHWGWYVEMKDGSCNIDSVPTSECSDVWEAKCRCIDLWEEQNQPPAAILADAEA